MSMFKNIAGAAVAVVLAAGVAQASPVYLSSGSFAVQTTTSSTSDIGTTTSFAITSQTVAVPIVGSFASEISPGLVIASPTNIDFTTATASSFDFSEAGLGSFVATSVVDLGGPVAGFHFYEVLGTLTLGSDWTNAGAQVAATENWTLNQNPAHNGAIQLGYTFATDVPEPATLTLLGVGLAGVGAFRARRNKKSS